MSSQENKPQSALATEEAMVERHGRTMIWLLAMAMAVILTAVVCLSVAFSGINQAKREAARAQLGYINAVLRYAELTLEKQGLSRPEGGVLVSSYGSPAAYGEFERNLLGLMLETFGRQRGFDFSVSIYTDPLGEHLQIHYYPVAGRTNQRTDSFFILQDGAFNTGNI